MRTILLFSLAFVLTQGIFGNLAHAAVTCPIGCSPGITNPNTCYQDETGAVCNADGTSRATTQDSPKTGSSIQGSPRTGDQPGGSSVQLLNPLGKGITLPVLISKILGFVVQIGSIVIVFMLIFVGFKFVMAQGSDSKLQEARRNLLYTLIGALILLGAQAIALGIEATVRAISTGG